MSRAQLAHAGDIALHRDFAELLCAARAALQRTPVGRKELDALEKKTAPGQGKSGG
jgi:hypothetical protein